MSKEQSNLLLLGIGGGGGRLAAAVRARYAGDMRILCMDTDALANRELQRIAPDTPCVLFGAGRLAGNGTGGDSVKGREAFRDDVELLEPHLAGVRTAVILTCLGAGTGSGATPGIAQLLKNNGIATLCIATRPFRFEGQARQDTANRTRPEIKDYVDAFAEVPLDDLFAETGQDTLEAARQEADNLLTSGVTLLWRMLHCPRFVCADPERLHALLIRGGSVRFGSESASGDNRAARLMSQLKGNRLLRGSETLRRSKAIFVGILGGDDLRLAEINEIMKTFYSKDWCHTDCSVEMGTVIDPALNGRIELVVYAFESLAHGGTQEEPPILGPDFIKSTPKKRPKPQSGYYLHGGGRFQNVEPTLGDNNENLDRPTFSRRDLRPDR